MGQAHLEMRAFILINPPKGDRSGGGGVLALGLRCVCKKKSGAKVTRGKESERVAIWF